MATPETDLHNLTVVNAGKAAAMPLLEGARDQSESYREAPPTGDKGRSPSDTFTEVN